MPDLDSGIREAESREFRLSLPVIERTRKEGYLPAGREALAYIRESTQALVQLVQSLVPNQQIASWQQELMQRPVESLNTLGLGQSVEVAADLFLHRVYQPLLHETCYGDHLRRLYAVIMNTKDCVVRSHEGYREDGSDCVGEMSLEDIPKLSKQLQEEIRHVSLIREELEALTAHRQRGEGVSPETNPKKRGPSE